MSTKNVPIFPQIYVSNYVRDAYVFSEYFISSYYILGIKDPDMLKLQLKCKSSSLETGTLHKRTFYTQSRFKYICFTPYAAGRSRTILQVKLLAYYMPIKSVTLFITRSTRFHHYLDRVLRANPINESWTSDLKQAYSDMQHFVDQVKDQSHFV